ncbi:MULTISPECIES: hypothetical protein [Streptomyces]|uniref:Uncharacterized protein n=2 Tax=Streptomyces TaxID=1883 RepID=A0A9X8QUS0_9ACTN|nr:MULTISPECIES: hypothetical protein [Streptomyces]PNE39921.1 hypothetical protein AOB60_02220 [Streptomyces noursei]SHM26750.1 hypothetical protein SAMN05216268_109318 [Streptomyces yunnanensis]SHN31747.1 hypothetical protein SAMN05216268_13456 [Streptomyces yunnanensis]
MVAELRAVVDKLVAINYAMGECMLEVAPAQVSETTAAQMLAPCSTPAQIPTPSDGVLVHSGIHPPAEGRPMTSRLSRVTSRIVTFVLRGRPSRFDHADSHRAARADQHAGLIDHYRPSAPPGGSGFTGHP